MKTIHKITLGIALALAATSTCIISAQAKSNIKEALLSQNVEALTETESSSSTDKSYVLENASCPIEYCTVQITGGTININGTYSQVKEYCDLRYTKYTIVCQNTKIGNRSYCMYGNKVCYSSECK